MPRAQKLGAYLGTVPIREHRLAWTVAELGTVLAYPTYATYDRVQSGYTHLMHEICPPTDEPPDDAPALAPMRRAICKPRRSFIVSSRIASRTVTRSLEAFPS